MSVHIYIVISPFREILDEDLAAKRGRKNKDHCKKKLTKV